MVINKHLTGLFFLTRLNRKKVCRKNTKPEFNVLERKKFPYSLCRLFLVRESSSVAGVFVLTFCMNKKVYHCQLVQVRVVVVVVVVFRLHS